MLELSDKIRSRVSAKALMYYEAVVALIEAQQLEDRSIAELAQLEGKKPQKSNKYKSTPGGKLHAKRGSITTEQLLALLKKGPKTSRQLATIVRCNDETVRKHMSAAKGVTRTAGAAREIVWSLKASLSTKTAKTTKKKDAAGRTIHADKHIDLDKLVKYITANPGLGIVGLKETLHRSYGSLQEAIQTLVKNGRLKETQSMSKVAGRTTTTWIPA